jgi:hypothetical protein
MPIMPKSTSKSDAVAAVAKLVEVLTPLAVEDRTRAISAATILLGESGTVRSPAAFKAEEAADPQGVSAKGIGWMKKNGVSDELLDHTFSIDKDGIDIIAARMPGKSKRQQTLETYIICGLRAFLQTGEPAFGDKEARELCQRTGCYDSANHYNYVKGFGNRVTGSKDSGWRLTNPGLSQAAHIVKQLAQEGNN